MTWVYLLVFYFIHWLCGFRGKRLCWIWGNKAVAEKKPHSWFEINQDRSRDISRIIALIIKHILTVPSLGRKVLQVPILADAMLNTKLLPELASN